MFRAKTLPADFVRVTKERFFSTVGKLDVHPRPEPHITFWEMRNGHELIGVSFPGYKCEDAEGRYTTKKSYFVPPRFAA